VGRNLGMPFCSRGIDLANRQPIASTLATTSRAALAGPLATRRKQRSPAHTTMDHPRRTTTVYLDYAAAAPAVNAAERPRR